MKIFNAKIPKISVQVFNLNSKKSEIKIQEQDKNHFADFNFATPDITVSSDFGNYSSSKPPKLFLTSEEMKIINEIIFERYHSNIFYVNRYGALMNKFNINIVINTINKYGMDGNSLRIAQTEKVGREWYDYRPFDPRRDEYMSGIQLNFLAASSLSYIIGQLYLICPDIDLKLNSGTYVDASKKPKGSDHPKGSALDLYTVLASIRKNITINPDGSLKVLGVEDKNIVDKYSEYEYFFSTATVDSVEVTNENIRLLFPEKGDKIPTIESHLYTKIDISKVDINKLPRELRQFVIIDGIDNVLHVKESNNLISEGSSRPNENIISTINLSGCFFDLTAFLNSNYWTGIMPVENWFYKNRSYLDLETHHLSFSFASPNEYYFPIDENGQILSPEEFMISIENYLSQLIKEGTLSSSQINDLMSGLNPESRNVIMQGLSSNALEIVMANLTKETHQKILVDTALDADVFDDFISNLSNDDFKIFFQDLGSNRKSSNEFLLNLANNKGLESFLLKLDSEKFNSFVSSLTSESVIKMSDLLGKEVYNYIIESKK